MQSIKSPWAGTFDEFVGSIRESAIIAAPYITRSPVERLVRQLRLRHNSVRLDVLTNLHPDNSDASSLDIGALAWLCQQIPGATVRHLRYLHAKAYVADAHRAIVTSANLTDGGLWRNKELGVIITDPQAVNEIADDLQEYGNLGVPVPPDALVELDGMAQQARQSKAKMDAESSIAKDEHNAIRGDMSRLLAGLRTAGEEFSTNPKAALTAQFADVVKYVLRSYGPTRTTDMYSLAQTLKPELCSDDTDIIINGENFGRNWKRTLRNAQQELKRSGVVLHDGGRNGLWRLL